MGLGFRVIVWFSVEGLGFGVWGVCVCIRVRNERKRERKTDSKTRR